jgi:hypothetical protein
MNCFPRWRMLPNLHSHAAGTADVCLSSDADPPHMHAARSVGLACMLNRTNWLDAHRAAKSSTATLHRDAGQLVGGWWLRHLESRLAIGKWCEQRLCSLHVLLRASAAKGHGCDCHLLHHATPCLVGPAAPSCCLRGVCWQCMHVKLPGSGAS